MLKDRQIDRRTDGEPDVKKTNCRLSKFCESACEANILNAGTKSMLRYACSCVLERRLAI